MNGERIEACMRDLSNKIIVACELYDDGAKDAGIEEMVTSKKYVNRLCEAGEILIAKADRLGQRFDKTYPGAKEELRKTINRGTGVSSGPAILQFDVEQGLPEMTFMRPIW